MSDKQSIGVKLSTPAPLYPNHQQQTPEPPLEIWNEEQLEMAMKTLKEMHIQLRNLRTSIPRLLAPLTAQHQTPQIILEEFTKSIKTANEEIQVFERLMVAEESCRIFNQARKSRAENPEAIKPWSVTESPDWLIRNL
ncbi:hypothetical protein OnM2_025017 [Erysiphe neolycopersici]|uniref:Uncharacterized protein n=1 Tax=Erysiphe neolycopersici TaxID=212602 RepID=A0A420I189_9PEZI|nr:hypothetical protein OnM2_025017 [Erysiphe neolycopersici]